MEGNQGYVQEGPSFDDLMNNGGWSSGDQLYPQAVPTQDAYAQFAQTQSPYNYLAQEPSYPPPNSFSPYESQYQHARPSDVFGPTAYNNLDPSLQNPAPLYGSESSFRFAPQESATISPHSLYNAPSNQPLGRAGAVSNAAFQQQRLMNNFSPRPQDQPMYFNNVQDGNIPAVENMIRYPALSNGSLEYDHNQTLRRVPESNGFGNPQQTSAEPVQDPLRITHSDLTAENDSSSHPHLGYAPFMTWENSSVQIAPGLKS